MVNAKQVAGLFMQSCLTFAGDKNACAIGPRRPASRSCRPTCRIVSSTVCRESSFDASNKDGKFVLVSEDGGSCSVVAETASGTGVIADLEQDLNDAKITSR